MWSEVCFPLAGSICFRCQPRGVLPTSTPAAETFLPPETSPARLGDRVKPEQVVIHACAARPRQAVVVLQVRTPTPVASGRHFHLHGGPASSRRSSRPLLHVGRLSTSKVSPVQRLSCHYPHSYTLRSANPDYHR